MAVRHVRPSSRDSLLHITLSEEIMDSHSQTEVDGKARSSYRRHFVLVHGAGFGGWCWYKLANHLLVKSGDRVRVSSLDLGGGGIDPRDADHISTLDDYNQPLADFFRALPSDDKVIMVGHSAGGFNLTLAMERFPHKIAAAVFVTALMPLSGTTLSDTLNEVLSRIGSFGDSKFYYARGDENAATSVKLGERFRKGFLLQNSPLLDITLTDSLLKKFPLWGEAITYTNESYGRVPRVYVVAKDDKLIVEELQRKFIAANPPQMVYEIEGSDHCAFFSKSERLGEILLQIANKYICN